MATSAKNISFIILISLVFALVLVGAIMSILAASNAITSSYYNTYSQVRSAHQWLAISSSMALVVFVVFVVVIIVAWIADAFEVPPKNLDSISSANVISEDTSLKKYQKIASKFDSNTSTYTLIIIIMILLLSTMIVYNVFLLLAVLDLTVKKQGADDYLKTAYTEALVAAILTLVAVVILVPAFIIYLYINRTVSRYRKVLIGKGYLNSCIEGRKENFENKACANRQMTPMSTTTLTPMPTTRSSHFNIGTSDMRETSMSSSVFNQTPMMTPQIINPMQQSAPPLSMQQSPSDQPDQGLPFTSPIQKKSPLLMEQSPSDQVSPLIPPIQQQSAPSLLMQ